MRKLNSFGIQVGSWIQILTLKLGSTMRYHYMPVRMAAIQKSTSNKCWRGCGTKREPSYTVGGNAK